MSSKTSNVRLYSATRTGQVSLQNSKGSPLTALPQVLGSQHLSLSLLHFAFKAVVLTLAVNQNHHGTVKNCQCLGLTLTGSDLVCGGA